MKVWRLAAIALTILFIFNIGSAQELNLTGRPITGNIISYGTRAFTGVRTGSFSLTINSWTSNADVQRYITVLQEGGQDRLLDAIRRNNVGGFSVNNNLARDILVAVQTRSGNTTKIYAVFERWTGFNELRTGRRSLDFPMGYIEITLDSRGRGTGTYIAAARIRWRNTRQGYRIDIEDYQTRPARISNVRVQT